VKTVSVIKVQNDLKTRLLSDADRMAPDELRLVTSFVDFLDKSLNLNPEKRLTVKDALIHPFIYGNISKAKV
jgi:serine/threonine-protein kinase PRP4